MGTWLSTNPAAADDSIRPGTASVIVQIHGLNSMLRILDRLASRKSSLYQTEFTQEAPLSSMTAFEFQGLNGSRIQRFKWPLSCIHAVFGILPSIPNYLGSGRPGMRHSAHFLRNCLGLNRKSPMLWLPCTVSPR